MKDKLIIIGASGHGQVLSDIAIKMNKWKSISFLDDKLFPEGENSQVIGILKDAIKYKEEADFIVGIGNNVIREKVQKKLESLGVTLAILIHPTAVVGKDVTIGCGTAIMAGTVINVAARIGEGCIINTSCSVDHDSILEDYSHLSPGVHLGGTVRIGKRSWLGLGCLVNNNIDIVSDCIIGSGGVVISNVIVSGTYVGAPIRRIYK